MNHVFTAVFCSGIALSPAVTLSGPPAGSKSDTTKASSAATLETDAAPPKSMNAAEGNEAAEQQLIERIREIAARQKTDLSPEADLEVRVPELKELVKIADELLVVFPETNHREEALMVALPALADLAKKEFLYLRRLVVVCLRIVDEGASERLHSEADYFAIDGFIMMSKREQMAEGLRREGARKRYEEFLKDHPDSPRRPAARAGLVQLLLVMGQVDEAREQVEALRKEAPDEMATRRAEGELFRATAVGKPFTPRLPKPDGTVISSADWKGKPAIVHYWASFNNQSIADLARLKHIFSRHIRSGIQLVGVNLDTNEETVKQALIREMLHWPQIADRKGMDGEAVVGTGVIELPTYFVIDAEGIVRLVTNDVEEVRDLIDALKSGSVPGGAPGREVPDPATPPK